MTNTKSGVYVTHIGIDRIYIRGEDATKYSELPNVKVNERSIEKCGEDNLNCMIKETGRIKDYEGASGKMSFSNGTTIKDVFLKVVEGGEFVRLGE